MDHQKQLAFISQMTGMALQHAAATPNQPTPEGKMSHDKMLAFVSAMAKNGLAHFDTGGTALGGPTQVGPASNTTGGGWNGAVSNFLGTTNNFQAQAAPVQAGTNGAQLNNAYSGAQSAIGTQGAITNTLNGQLGQGANTQSALANMYLNQAQGGGPNPALASLNQQTGQNIAQTAALMASQRGAGANAGLLARSSAQQGANIQQNAIGQAATEQAQQQLAAEGNLQNLAANQVAQGQSATQGLSNANQNEQSILQGANTSFNNANVSQQSNLNNVNASVATANQNNSQNIVSGVGNALSHVPVIGSFFAQGGLVHHMDKRGRVLNAKARGQIAAGDFALPGSRYPIHDPTHARIALAHVSQNGTPAEKAKVKAAVAKKYAQGGQVVAPKMYAQGALVGQATSGPQSFVGQWLNSTNQASSSPQVAQANLSSEVTNPFERRDRSGADKANEDGSEAATGKTIGLSAPLNTAGADSFDLGAGAGGLDGLASAATAFAADGGLLEKGGNVKANSSKEKAKVNGDSYSNDKIPAMLSEGEIVIPREITMGPNAPQKAALFVAQELAKRGKKK